MRRNKSRSVKGFLQSRSQRDEQAFQTLHEQTWEEIFTLAYRKLKDEDEAYDLVQELYMELWEKRSLFPPEEVTKPWLKKRLWYSILSYFRNSGIRQKQMDDFQAFVESEVESLYRDAQEDLQLGESEKAFQAVLDEIALVVADMPARMQQIYILNKEQHISISEIADRLGISPHTVRYHLQEALKRLRSTLSVY